MSHQERVNIAVFIDFDNIEIGVRTTLGEHFDVNLVLEAMRERGEVVTKIAYADWTRAGEYSRHLTQHAIRLVQRNLTPGGDKNGADINLALDALEMAFTHTHINAYVIVGGDSDFLSLVEKLKQYNKKVFVLGGRQFTSVILQRNCHEFIAYENLVRSKPSQTRVGRPSASLASSPLASVFPLVRRALKILADREVSPQTGLLKSTLLQLDPTFSERSYGASSFLDFAEKLSQAGLVQLKHAGRSVMVELNPDFADDGENGKPRAEGESTDAAALASAAPEALAPDSEGLAPGLPPALTPGAPPAAFPRYEELPRLGDQADGVKATSQILAAAAGARWPMYLRNVKQILRAANFDERRYGYGGLMDLLKACQRDGLLRVERDRRGGLRVFQGGALRGNTASVPAAHAPVTMSHEASEVDGNVASAVVVENTPSLADLDPDIIDEPVIAVVDTTAELLGRAKPKKGRTRTTPVDDDAPEPAVAARNARPGGRGGVRKSGGPKRGGPAAGGRRGRGHKRDKDGDVDGNR